MLCIVQPKAAGNAHAVANAAAPAVELPFQPQPVAHYYIPVHPHS